MKRLWLALLMILILGACSSKMYKSAYTASGDVAQPDKMDKTSTFKPNEDLNVVVTLNSHERTLPVRATFIAPDGTQYGTDPLEAEATVGKVALGLDWQAMGGQMWPAGQWKADIYVEDKKVDTLTFNVQAAAGGVVPAQG